MEERLQKYLAAAGIASRRKAEDIILEGRVKVNGRVVTELGIKIDPHADIVEVDNKAIEQKEKYIYIMLNKPSGYLSTVKDDFGRKTVLDLLTGIDERVYPVGRLDYDTEGLLLLTNDGDLSYQLTHPKHEKSKTYQALIQGLIDRQKLDKLEKGIMLEDGPTAPAKCKLLKHFENSSLVEVTIYEGRKRQVRRMFKEVGHRVIKLRRTSEAFLKLGSLEVGQYRFLSKEEVRKLKS